MATKTEDGRAFEQGDYCYTPDPDVPSGWKLRITDTPGGAPDPGIVGAAAAALGAGFRGNTVDIPSDARAGVVACVRRAWHAAHPGMGAAEMPEGIRTAETPEMHTVELDSVIEVRSLSKREIDVRLMPWGRVINTASGLETFERGAFDDAVPSDVLLMGLEHEAFIGIGQNGQARMTRHPVGKGIALDSRDDAQYGTFRVAPTARGDEVLALASEGIAKGVSVEFSEIPGGSRTETRAGRRVRIHSRARLSGASTTYMPAYEEATVVAVRTEKEPEMAEIVPAATAAPAIDMAAFTAAAEQMAGASARIEAAAQARASEPSEAQIKMLERLEKLEEQGRASFTIPAKPDDKPYPQDFTRGDWLKLVLRTLSGESVSQAELKARADEDLITSDNLGVIPTAYLGEVIGIINASRPFLQTTRNITTPANGMTISVPKIVTRPTVDVQGSEKSELDKQKTSIVPVTFEAVTIGGYGDISIQLLKRSDPSYLTMYTDLLAEAYALKADDEATDALLDEADVHEGGAVDPNDGLQFGDAWANAQAVSTNLVPDTIWLSTRGVAAFIDARNDTTNAPLYANLAASFTAAGGVGGTISGLRPVHVPALNGKVDILVGPSRGFGWSEDGSFTLQVDVPAKAGRDVAIVGMLWFMPMYPGAFTSYGLSS